MAEKNKADNHDSEIEEVSAPAKTSKKEPTREKQVAEVAKNKTYLCKAAVNFNKQAYQPGHSIVLPEAEAQALIEVGAVELA